VDNRAGGGVFVNDGSLWNYGEILNSDPNTYISNFRGLINNYGAISNLDDDAFISNRTLGYLKNRGGAIDILAGWLENLDTATVTNVNGGVITIADNATFNNNGLSSLLLNRALGEVYNSGTFINFNFALVENHGTFENFSWFDNSGASFVTNEDGGTFRNHARFDNRGSAELDNIGLFETTGDLDNACDGVILNFGLGVLNGAFENWGGSVTNLGTWNPGPTQRACDYTPP